MKSRILGTLLTNTFILFGATLNAKSPMSFTFLLISGEPLLLVMPEIRMSKHLILISLRSSQSTLPTRFQCARYVLRIEHPC